MVGKGAERLNDFEDLRPARLLAVAGDHPLLFQQEAEGGGPADLFRGRSRRPAGGDDPSLVVENDDGGDFRLAGNLFHQLLQALRVGGG